MESLLQDKEKSRWLTDEMKETMWHEFEAKLLKGELKVGGDGSTMKYTAEIVPPFMERVKSMNWVSIFGYVFMIWYFISKKLRGGGKKEKAQEHEE